MNFMPAAWQIRRARLAQEEWNATRQDCFVPWEWVEEMLLACCAWQETGVSPIVGHGTEESDAHMERFIEFRKKIPHELLWQIFPSD